MTHAQRAIIQAIADHGDENGNRIYPSYAYVAWRTDFSIRQVKRVVAGMVKLGAIIVTARGNSHGRSNSYRLNYEAFPRKPPFRGGVTMTPGVVTPAVGGSDKTGRGGDIAMAPQSPSRTIRESKKRARVDPKDSRALEEPKRREVVEYWQKLVGTQRTATVIAMLSGAKLEDVERWKPK